MGEHLGRWIRRQREARGWTQPDLANAAGTTSNTVSRWERGYREPTLRQFAKVCKALRASADDALGLKRPRPKRRRPMPKLRRRAPSITTPPPPPPLAEHEAAAS